MKIVLLQTPLSPLNIDRHGGLERVELTELDYLNRWGHSVSLYAASIVGKKENVYRITDFGANNRFLKFLYYLIFGCINRRADIFHGHYTPMLALLFPEKTVVHFHGMAVSELILYRYFAGRYRKAKYIFCSRWVKEEFQKMYADIPSSQLYVVYNGVDVESIKPPAERSLSGKLNVCFYGRWVPEKGIYDMLKVAEILESKGRTDFTLWYGGWSDSDEINRTIKAWADRLKSVRIVGNINQADLPAFLQTMDIGIVPSVYLDPFPLVPLEMMAAGLPVIAYDLGGPREEVIDGVTGFLVEQNPQDLAERIEFLLDDRNEILRMGEAAREHIEKHFTWERHMNKLLDIYNLIICKP